MSHELPKHGFITVSSDKIQIIAEEYISKGYRAYVLSERASCKDDFFQAIRNRLPLDPPLQSNQSWDALSDSLWEGIRNSSEQKFTIVWKDSDSMPESDRVIAYDILRSCSETLHDVLESAKSFGSE